MIPAVAIPALIALVCKLGLLGYSMRVPPQTLTTRLLQLLLVAFAMQNLVELIGFNYFENEVITPALTRIGFIYIALLVPVIALVLHLSLRLSFDPAPTDVRARLQPLLYIPGAALLFLLVATDQLVAGFQAFRSSILRIPGPWYILFESYVISYLLGAFLSLVYGARPSRKSPKGRSRNRLWLLALLPTGALLVYLIVANHFGAAKITSTIYVPIPMTIFLVVATYATYHKRLPDLAFFIPGSRVRRRKAALYDRVQKMIAEIGRTRLDDELAENLARTFCCPVAIIDRDMPSLNAVNDAPARAENDNLLAQFPPETLHKVNQIVVVDEIEESDPKLYEIMKRYNVEAVVPFKISPRDPICWVLFESPFVEAVHTPRDFKYLEMLFERIEASLLENVSPLRAQLGEATGKLERVKRQLAVSWHELEDLRRKVGLAESERYQLSLHTDSPSIDHLQALESEVPGEIVSGEQSLWRYLREREAIIVKAALKSCGGDKTRAARLLGVESQVLCRLIERHGLDFEGFA